jgi:cell wall assembly regulator SMI1
MNFEDYLNALREAYEDQDRELLLHEPARKSELDALEAALGFSLPRELRELWNVANGSPSDCPLFLRPGYLTAYSLLSANACVKYIELMKKRAPQYSGYVPPEPWPQQIAQSWYEVGWFPFAEFAGLLLILDHSPSARGGHGQVISFTHDPDEMQFHASSLGEFLERNLEEMDFWIEEALL